MPTYLPQIEPNRTGSLNSLDIPMNDWLGIKFGVGQDDTVGNAVSRWSEDFFDNSPEMKPEAAQLAFPGPYKFTVPIKVQTAMRKQERKEKELRYSAFLNAASHDSLSWKALAGTSAMMLGSVAHPLDLGLTFVPFVGEARIGGGVARFGAREMINRGIMGTTDDLAKIAFVRRFPNLTASVINGTLGNAVAEIPIGLQKWSDQADYGIEDALANVAFGGVAGGAFHGLGRLLKAVGIRMGLLDPATAEEGLKRAVNDAIEGRELSAHEPVRWSEEEIAREIRAKNVFDDHAAIAMAESQIGKSRVRLSASALDLLDSARRIINQKSETAGPALQLISEFLNGNRNPEVFIKLADMFGLKYDPSLVPTQPALKLRFLNEAYGGKSNEAAATANVESLRRKEISIQIKDISSKYSQSGADRQEIVRLNSELNQSIQRYNEAKALEQNKFAALSAQELSYHEVVMSAEGTMPYVSADAVVAERARRIADYVEREKARHEIEVTGKIKDEVAARIAAQQAQGRVLPDKEIEQWSKAEAIEPSHVEAMKKDAQTIEEQMMKAAEEKRVVSVDDVDVVEAEAARQEKAIKAAKERIAKIKEQAHTDPEDKAINEAIDCLTRGRTE